MLTRGKMKAVSQQPDQATFEGAGAVAQELLEILDSNTSGENISWSAVMSAVGRRRIRLPARLAYSIQMIPKPKKESMMANTSVYSGDSATSAHDRSVEEIDELRRKMGQLATQMSAVMNALHTLVGKIEKTPSVGNRSRMGSQVDFSVPLNRTQSWVQSLPESEAMANVNAIGPAKTTSSVDQPLANLTLYQTRAFTVASNTKPKSVGTIRTADNDVQSDVTSASQTGPDSVKQCVVSFKSDLTNTDPKAKTKVGSTSDSQTKCFIGIKLRPYAGDQHVDQYLAQFKLVANLSGWPEEQWGGRLAASLEGKARRILTLEPLPSRPSFELVSRLLRASFASETSPEVYGQELENRQRGEKEKLADLSHSITDVMA